MTAQSGNSERRTRRSASTELAVYRQFALQLVSLTEVDDLLWYVAESVVGQLGYVDCVIYRLAPDGKTLVQAAAMGEKSPQRRQIKNALEIPVGEGITGHTAATRQPSLIRDTRNDARYIHDLMKPGSEACVPILHGEELLGVLDSEHPDPDWFQEQDIDTLQSVAALTSAQWVQCELIRSLKATTRRLEIAEREADSANRAKSNFLANISHEVRTPLNGIAGCLEILRDRSRESADLPVIDRARQSTRDLVALIENMLDFSRIEADSLSINRSASSIRELAAYSIDTFPPLARAAGLGMDIHSNIGSGIGMADLPKIKQIVNNLVTNAIKFTDTGSVSLSLDWGRDSDLVIKVTDTGIGMDAATRDRIFHRFVIADESRSRRHGGAGLGLAICRNLVKLMGGQIHVTSDPGKGSEFLVRLPVEQAAPERRKTPAGTADLRLPDLSGFTLLVAEDSETNAYIASHHLQRCGAKILIAHDGLEAVSMAENQYVDAILMDVSMPGMDGLEASRRIRKMPDLEDLPIIALTAHVGEDNVRACYEAGMTDYLSKPLNRGRLFESLSEHLTQA